METQAQVDVRRAGFCTKERNVRLKHIVPVVLLGGLIAILFTVIPAAGSSPNQATAKTPRSLLGPFPKRAVTLKVWDWVYGAATSNPNDPTKVGEQKFDKYFTKLHPNVKIDHQGFPFSAYWPTKAATFVATKQGPDVTMAALNASQPLWKGFWPLRNLISPGVAKTIPLLPDAKRDDPSVHMMPYSNYAYAWVYNKALFRKAGITSVPTTWSQLLSTCDKLRTAGITPMSAGFSDGWLGQWLITYGFASQLFSPTALSQWATGKINWSYPRIRQSLTAMVNLQKRGCYTPNSWTRTTFSDAQDEFVAGKAAMTYWYVGPGTSKTWGTGIGPSNVGMFRMPRLPNDPYKTYPIDVGAGWYWAITRFTKHCRVAYEYLKDLTSPKGQQIVLGVNPNGPQASKDPNDVALAKWLTDPTNHHGPSAGGPEERVLYLKLYPQLIAGQISIDDFIKQENDARAKAVFPTNVEKSPACTG